MAVVGRSSWSSWSIWVSVVLGVWVDRAVAISVWSSLLIMSAMSSFMSWGWAERWLRV
ncbi:hypothetical protein ODS41_03215 [Pyrobaculum sp. 3827-6]|uniref:hypothetical protein n=1 Tax=Pyrobaculum sp. 3827-6 TaxID=2983604 RepID=UPI0021D95798|nr:hypothetical protein [Pyrobaculum sp. 3827-6]MCU7786938.1 hypothetical protein [Pyrobaculum sp. 3827-6]